MVDLGRLQRARDLIDALASPESKKTWGMEKCGMNQTQREELFDARC